MPKFTRLVAMTAVAISCFAAAVMPAPSQAQDADESRYLVLVDCDSERTPGRWFANDASLQRLRNRSHTVVFDRSDLLYRTRYARSIPRDVQPPLVILANHDGRVIYMADRRTMPRSAADLFAAIDAATRVFDTAAEPSRSPPSSDRDYRSIVGESPEATDTIEEVPAGEPDEIESEPVADPSVDDLPPIENSRCPCDRRDPNRRPDRISPPPRSDQLIRPTADFSDVLGLSGRVASIRQLITAVIAGGAFVVCLVVALLVGRFLIPLLVPPNE